MEHGVCNRLGKIPENPSPVPAPFFEYFWDFPQKNPQRLSLPRPQSIPKPFRGSIPVPIPVFWGFLGIEPQKNSKSNPSPSPKNPQNFSKPLSPSPLCPQNLGMGTGKFRDYPILFTNLKLNGTRAVLTWVQWVQLHQQFFEENTNDS